MKRYKITVSYESTVIDTLHANDKGLVLIVDSKTKPTVKLYEVKK